MTINIYTDINLAGAWTSIDDFQRNRSIPAITTTGGRPDETQDATPSSMTGQFDNTDGRFTSRNPVGAYYPSLNRNTPVRLATDNGSAYLRLADDTTSAVQAPDSAALQITANITVDVDMAPDSYMPCVLFSKWGGTGTAWVVLLNGDGTVTFQWFDGTNTQALTSTAPIGLGRVAVRCGLNHNTGTVTFATAPQIGSPFTQLGNTVTIGAATTVSAAAGQLVAVAGFSGTAGYAGFTGQFYEARIFNSAGTVVADPVFTAQTAGVTSFTDAQSNTWTLIGTAQISSRAYIYHGELSSLPVAWDPSGHDKWVPYQAGGILRRLQQGNAPILSSMRRYEAALSGLVGCWPCEDLSGATQIASGLPGGNPMLITSTAQPSLGSDSTFACSNPLPDIESSTWSAVPSVYADTGTLVVRFLAVPKSSSGTQVDFLGINTTGTGGGYEVLVTPGTAGWQLAGGGQGLLTSSIGPASAPAMVSVELTASGGNITATLRTMLVNGTITTSTASPFAGTIGRVTSIRVNDALNSMGSSVCGHITVSDTLTALSGAAPALAAHAGETAGNRVARLCAENNIAARIYGYPDTTVAMGAQQIDTLINVLQECEDADHGLIYEPFECLGVGYRTLNSICAELATGPVVTIDYSKAQAGDQESSPVSLTSIDDDQYTTNDWTVTNGNGSSLQVTLDDGSPMSISPPPTGIGDYANSKTVWLQFDTQLPDAAGWLLNVSTSDEERYPSVVTGLHRAPIINAGLVPQILATRIGDFAEIINPPAWLPPGPVRLIITGRQDTLTSFLHQVSWNCVPAAPYGVMVASDAVFSHANPDPSVLHASVSSGATTIQVAEVSAISPLWTTSAADFPFDIVIAGERMTVTNITGSSSPQTFTVTRSVNGVVKAQTIGAPVTLIYPPVAALV